MVGQEPDSTTARAARTVRSMSDLIAYDYQRDYIGYGSVIDGKRLTGCGLVPFIVDEHSSRFADEFIHIRVNRRRYDRAHDDN